MEDAPAAVCSETGFRSLNVMAVKVHDLAKEKGWYDTPETQQQFISRTCNNITGEVSELWESARKSQLDELCDKDMEAVGLPPLTCLDEELADIVIRVLDAAAHLGVDLSRAVAIKHSYNGTRPYRHGGKIA